MEALDKTTTQQWKAMPVSRTWSKQFFICVINIGNVGYSATLIRDERLKVCDNGVELTVTYSKHCTVR